VTQISEGQPRFSDIMSMIEVRKVCISERGSNPLKHASALVLAVRPLAPSQALPDSLLPLGEQGRPWSFLKVFGAWRPGIASLRKPGPGPTARTGEPGDPGSIQRGGIRKNWRHPPGPVPQSLFCART